MPFDAALLGVDFSCAPSRRKPITVARGRLRGRTLRLDGIDELHTLGAFEALLARPGPWFGGFDFPFGLPREFVTSNALGGSADAVIAELRRRCPDRIALRALIDAWGNGRPPGQRLVHRRTDTATPGASSSSPLQTRYVPVGFMYFEGFSRLVAAGVHVPRLRECREGDRTRVAVEAYPGRLAIELIGRRSYKNGDDGGRGGARRELIDALEQGRTRLALRVTIDNAMRDTLAADTSGDRIDALLALVQAAWASRRADFGVPADVDPIEGWIVGAV